jgi:HAD superfamily hydrolase (TIGR01509 family)
LERRAASDEAFDRPSTAAYDAVVFDMDGVLTDSEPAFHAAVNDVLARFGEHIAMEEYRHFIGMATPAMWTRMIALKKLPVALDEVLEMYEPPLMERLRQPRPPLPYARETVERLRRAGVPLALCTASYRRWVDAILESAGLTGLFGEAISCADLVERTKPDPEPYSLAARLLGVPAERCIAVEDSANGVASAAGAGMYVIQLRATETAASPQPGAQRVIDTLAEFPFDLVAPRAG